mmetsp:Transcript_148314/g.385577  ORF Transcript_148314/g.385577 Transcript_148314/m.385577 type:complete len:203 (-) Transcript_148314:503-1111(-)
MPALDLPRCSGALLVERRQYVCVRHLELNRAVFHLHRPVPSRLASFDVAVVDLSTVVVRDVLLPTRRQGLEATGGCVFPHIGALLVGHHLSLPRRAAALHEHRPLTLEALGAHALLVLSDEILLLGRHDDVLHRVTKHLDLLFLQLRRLLGGAAAAAASARRGRRRGGGVVVRVGDAAMLVESFDATAYRDDAPIEDATHSL